MKILSLNPGHDGAIAYLDGGRLEFSIEAEKDSNSRYAPLHSPDVLKALGEIEELPDVICTAGWWERDHYEFLHGSTVHRYRGVSRESFIIEDRRLFGKPIKYFSSSHERSHIMSALGMSPIPKGTPCYALVWEGSIGAFYEIDADLNITAANVLSSPGNRYALLYGLADPTFPKTGEFPRSSDAGKLMALASFSKRSRPTQAESRLLDFLLSGVYRGLSEYDDLERAPHLNAGLEDPEFRNFAGIYSDAIFDVFHLYAEANLRRDMPLVIAGGCGLNCDWNTKWRQSGLFSAVFVPPVANDSGSAIGAAIDAQFHFTGDPKIEWSVYAGQSFVMNEFDEAQFEKLGANVGLVADLLANDMILAWVDGKYEIGPRALGNRSLLAAPFAAETRIRLNVIKQREQFRPIAPICLEEDARIWFGCDQPSPHMLFTYQAQTEALRAVTHVNGTARLQTVSPQSNKRMHELLSAFKARTGFGVLCNTSLNFNGRGFINRLSDLARYTVDHALDGFVVEGQVYLSRASERARGYLNSTVGRDLRERRVDIDMLRSRK